MTVSNSPNLMEVFRTNSYKSPGKIAVIFEGRSFTYLEIEEKSNFLALKIADHFSSEINDFHSENISNPVFPLLMDPSIEFLITTFALHKLGLGYVPISSKYPSQKINRLLEQVNKNLLITNLPSCEYKNSFFVSVNELNSSNSNELNIQFNPTNIAYIIFTSGSTGEPKGVKVTFKNLNGIINSCHKTFNFGPHDRLILYGNISFDFSVYMLFGWILGGGSLAIFKNNIAIAMKDFTNFLVVNHPTFIPGTPSVIDTFVNILDSNQKDILSTQVKCLLVGGEELKINTAKNINKVFHNSAIYNVYGPTETTIFSSYYLINESDYQNDKIPIGYPLPHVGMHLMDEQNNIVKVKNSSKGFEHFGQIIINGVGVSDGYFKMPIQSNEKFVSMKNEYTYLTGDYAKIIDDKFYFYGRKDNQVQINGVRVELEEIETIINKALKSINQICLFYENKDYILFYCGEFFLTYTELESKLKHHLEMNQIPKTILKVKGFPLNENGKIDRQKMYLDYKKKITNSNSTTANSELTIKIIKIFHKIFDNNTVIDENSDFFNLGGDSLGAIQLLCELEKELNLDLSVDHIYNNTTPLKLSTYLHKEIKSNQKKSIINLSLGNRFKFQTMNCELIKSSYLDLKSSLLSLGTEEIYNPSFFQKFYIEKSFHSFVNFEIKVQKQIPVEKLKSALNTLINKVDSLRTQFIFENNKTIALVHSSKINHDFDVFISPPSMDAINEFSKNDLLKAIKSLVSKSLLNNLLYYVCIFINQDSTFTVQFILHQNIADAASVAILKKLLLQFIDGDFENKIPRFSEYISLSRNLNDDPNKVISSSYFNDLMTSVEKFKRYDLSSIFNKVVTFDIENNFPFNQKFGYVHSLITSYILQSTGAHSLVFQSIFNFRRISGKDFSNLVGDCHGSILLNRNLSETDSFFSKRFMEFIEEKYLIDGLHWHELIYINYPELNKNQIFLKNLYDSVPISINYIGEKTSEEANEALLENVNTKNEISKLVEKLRILAFTSDTKLYVMRAT